MSHAALAVARGFSTAFGDQMVRLIAWSPRDSVRCRPPRSTILRTGARFAIGAGLQPISLMVTAAVSCKPMPSKPMPSKPVTFKSMTAKSVAAKPVDSVEMMSAQPEEDARPITIVSRIITIVIIGVGGSNIATRPIASTVIVADEVHGGRRCCFPGTDGGHHGGRDQRADAGNAHEATAVGFLLTNLVDLAGNSLEPAIEGYPVFVQASNQD